MKQGWAQAKARLTVRFTKKEHTKKYPRVDDASKHTSITCIDVSELGQYSSSKLKLYAPDIVFTLASWRRVPVTVKYMAQKSYEKMLKKDMLVLSQIRHPRIANLLAVGTGPVAEQMCLVLECFKIGSLHFVLHETSKEISLPDRVAIFCDVSEGLEFLKSRRIVHCFLNSHSIMIYQPFRAKICNLEYSQKEGSEPNESYQMLPIDACVKQHPWMAPEQLDGEPTSFEADVYRGPLRLRVPFQTKEENIEICPLKNRRRNGPESVVQEAEFRKT
ncbi:predicted protein [Nematostella vectensis]|uniref:Protein kinase domain-containing protein n=1 Tax=Nematostella vectensis TaxID=45351 RepID=A7SMW0_NEMVE|nr:predicted protein [Nematostella vectensis]|eukprot:XP_001627065.1 predicted protein [Nematostella vectensis]